jgi:hypothetical protein
VDFLLNLYQIFDSYKALYPLLIFLSLISIWFIREKVKYISARLTVLDNLIQKVTTILDDEEHGNPKIFLVLLQDIRKELDTLEDTFLSHIPLCNQHFRDIDKILDKSVYEKCNIKNCSELTEIITAIDRLAAAFSNFDKVAEESRQNSGSTLGKLNDKLDDLRTEVNATTKGTLSILSDSLRDRK